MNSQLQSIISDTLGIPLDSVDPSLQRQGVENWDSLNHLRLVTAVEEAFDVKLRMADIQEIRVVADLCRLVGDDGAAEEYGSATA